MLSLRSGRLWHVERAKAFFPRTFIHSLDSEVSTYKDRHGKSRILLSIGRNWVTMRWDAIGCCARIKNGRENRVKTDRKASKTSQAADESLKDFNTMHPPTTYSRRDRLPSPQGNPMDRLSVAAEPVRIEMATDNQSLMGYVAETSVKALDRLCVARELAHGDALGDNSRIPMPEINRLQKPFIWNDLCTIGVCEVSTLQTPADLGHFPDVVQKSAHLIMQANNAMSLFSQSDYTPMPQLNANEMGMIGSGYYGQSQQYQQLLK
ncbi:hypothetical protein DFH08DRAFT_827220 [Mycena albidolilacea]|uniref:Uncharacterized protein n=1 Tax=Mycena albidolilacea TaxID=1033008 RepID=A0AAD6YZP5_9AGAR|nr:hypothetical protein DFH08DRAFT_827220 [Mycena albidolilacea]